MRIFTPRHAKVKTILMPDGSLCDTFIYPTKEEIQAFLDKCKDAANKRKLVTHGGMVIKSINNISFNRCLEIECEVENGHNYIYEFWPHHNVLDDFIIKL